MPGRERIYENAPPKSSRVPRHRHNNHHSSHLESNGMNLRCTRSNMVLISLCVSLLCGIIVLGVLYAMKENTLQQSNNTGQCSDGWDFFNGSCYFFSHDELNWTASRDECVSAGGHLVIIDSKEEQSYITQKIVNTVDGFWIGLTDFEKEGHWKWVDNTKLRLKFWYQGQPNNKQIGADKKDTPGEDCGLVRDVSQEQNWYDEYCGASENRICETKFK